MSAPLIDHIGILVPDLESAIEKWERATGYTFSPIARYRTSGYSDDSDVTPHDHNARFAVSREGTPHIELLEAAGTGSHSLARLGPHHLAVRVASAEAEAERVRDLGHDIDTWARMPDGSMHICFTARQVLDGVALEFISEFPGPIVLDDGSLPWRDPETGRASLWGEPQE
ncbi:VOC family protein [Mycetocola sp. 2940]|uniref:VOC family protein n=1 Tax=Mycetocola sp. 2940 TaxID=3156452 RepID=UPI003396410A